MSLKIIGSCPSEADQPPAENMKPEIEDYKAPPFSIQESLLIGWEALQTHYHVFIPLVLLSVAVSFVNEYLGNRSVNVLYTAAIVLGVVAELIVGMGIIKVALKITAGETVMLNDVFSVTHLFFFYIGASILYGLIVLGGLLLLVVPGLIWLVTYWLFSYVLIDTECGVMTALSEVKRISKGARWHIFLFMAVTVILNIAGVLAFFIGLSITIPITVVATAHVYRKLVLAHEKKECVSDSPAFPHEADLPQA